MLSSSKSWREGRGQESVKKREAAVLYGDSGSCTGEWWQWRVRENLLPIYGFSNQPKVTWRRRADAKPPSPGGPAGPQDHQRSCALCSIYK
jgi:hypothetical protein